MTWSDVYLICFLVGFALSLVSFLGGTHLHLHLPHAVGHHAGFAGGHHGGGRGTTVSRINFATVTAFLAWFGGTGYLLSLYSGASFPLVFTVAGVSGLAGAAVVFWFVAKVAVFLYFYLWFRASWPRYRYDQLMKLGWQILLPLSIANVIVTAVLVLVLGPKG